MTRIGLGQRKQQETEEIGAKPEPRDGKHWDRTGTKSVQIKRQPAPKERDTLRTDKECIDWAAVSTLPGGIGTEPLYKEQWNWDRTQQGWIGTNRVEDQNRTGIMNVGPGPRVLVKHLDKHLLSERT